MKIAALQSTDRRCAMATRREKDHSVPKVSSVPAVMTGGRKVPLGPPGSLAESDWSPSGTAPSCSCQCSPCSHPLPVWPNINLWAVAKATADTEQQTKLHTSTVPRAPSYAHSFAPQNSVTYNCDDLNLTGREAVHVWAKTTHPWSHRKAVVDRVWTRKSVS